MRFRTLCETCSLDYLEARARDGGTDVESGLEGSHHRDHRDPGVAADGSSGEKKSASDEARR